MQLPGESDRESIRASETICQGVVNFLEVSSPTPVSADSVHGCAGSAEIGRCIVPHPHIRQVVVPSGGARLILGSDGLWEPLATSKVFSMCQQLPPQAAAARLSSVAYRAQVPACQLEMILYPSVGPSQDQGCTDWR